MLALEGEGSDVAEWLRARGIAAFVLKYRLRETGPTRAEFSEDLVRSLAAAAKAETARATFPPEPEYRAHAVEDVTAALRLIRARAAGWRIDPQRLGAIGFSAGAYVLTWALADGTERLDGLACVYGGRLAPADVPSTAPALFTTVAARDVLCATDVLALIDAWRSHGLSVEAHLYDSDAHGFGIAQRGVTTDPWSERYAEWLQRTGFAIPELGAKEER
jgi:dienelactone hydrolase